VNQTSNGGGTKAAVQFLARATYSVIHIIRPIIIRVLAP
jgi:hypothetical protein